MSDLCLLSNYSAKIIKFFIIVASIVNKYPLFRFYSVGIVFAWVG